MRILIAVALMVAVPAWSDHVFHVAPEGDDAASGSAESPWQTLEGARDNLRALRADGALTRRVIVNLRGEHQRAGAPLRLTQEDSGAPGAPVVWRSEPGHEAVISGGYTIREWTVRDGLWVADVSMLSNAETGSPSALWIDGERRTVARTPNVGEYFRTDGQADPSARVDLTAGRTYENHAFAYTEGLEPWPDLDQALVVAFHAWEASYHRIAELTPEQFTVQFVNDAWWRFGQWERHQRFYVENVRAALDQPGEWYVDRKAGLLYYLPRPGETPDRVTAVIPAVRHVLFVDGDPESGAYAEHLEFEGLTFAYTDWPIGAQGHSDPQAAHSVGAAVEWRYVRHGKMRDCTIRNTGGYGLWLGSGCQRNRIERCHIHELGAGGVRVGGNSRPTGQMTADDVTATRNKIENTWIHDGGKIYHAGVGVWIGHANYTTLSHLEISDFYYTGVSNGWVWGYGDNPAHHNIVEYCHIHNIGKRVLSDMGGIYNLGIQPGTILRNNVIHDIYSNKYGGWGLYTDEGSTEIQMLDNVVYNTTDGGFHQHYGRNNRVRNNIFAFSETDQTKVTRVEEHRSVVFERNIVLSRNKHFHGSNWTKADVWSDYNCYWNLDGPEMEFGGMSLGQWMATGHDLNSIAADPKFADPDAGDFTLAADSPVWALGFEPIDTSRVGLVGWGPGADAAR